MSLVEPSYTIDLLQFQDEDSTELVPPVKLDAGKYTQVRIVVNSATLRFVNGGAAEDRPVEIPSGNLKTDKNFIFNVPAETAVDVVIHFDLSMSLVVSGTAPNQTYTMKPVMHLFGDPLQAATITGSIDNSSDSANIIVYAESNQEEFTKVVIPMSAATNPAEFSIFWIVPNQSCTVQIDFGQDGLPDCDEFVQDTELPEGSVFDLNSEDPIRPGLGICS